MADEFIKGFGALMVGGLGWMTIAGWYKTPSFEGAQLIGEAPPAEELTLFDNIALMLGDAFFWFAIFGCLTFWVLIPFLRELRVARSNFNEEYDGVRDYLTTQFSFLDRTA